MAGLAAHLARAFERGEAPTLASLARETGVTKAAAMHGLTALEDAGVARQVYEDEDGRTAPGGSSTVGIGSGDGGEGDSRWTLARPASRVSMTTVMDAMSRAGSSDAADDDLAMSAFRDRLSSALDDVTLAALIDDADAIAAERLQDAGRYDGRRRSGAPDGGRKDDAGEGDDDGDDGAEREGAGERSPTRERSGAGS
jgi:DNA-binding IscR family transcriptional regulator